MTDAFQPFADKMRAAQQPEIAINTFAYYYNQLVAGQTGLMSETEIEPVDELPDSERLSGMAQAGRDALSKAVVIKLNGGLGTSMGMTKAKSLLPIKSGHTFLDVIAKQALKLRSEFACRLPLVLMNSFRTREDSLAALSGHDGLSVGLPLDFVQHKVPKIRADDMTPVAWDKAPTNEWCPPGHGDLYTALVTSGMLDELIDEGYEYVFVSNSDNLGAVMDTDILGFFADSGSPFLMEVADRTAADRKGGHLARRKSDGWLTLRESAQCPDADKDTFQDHTLHRFFNTNNLWFRLSALKQILQDRDGVMGLPMIRNTKNADPSDADSPKVFQLETAMGAAISVFEGARAIRVPRSRFVPVKTTADLLRVWSDVYELTTDWRIIESAARTKGTLLIDLDTEYYKLINQLMERFPEGAPSLVDCDKLTVEGDVRFGANVTMNGPVALKQTGLQPLTIPDGAVLP